MRSTQNSIRQDILNSCLVCEAHLAQANMVHGQELYGVGLQETVACMDQGRRCCEKLNILKMFSRKANYRFYQHPMHVMLCLGRPSFRKTHSNLDFSKQGGAGGLGDHPIQILTM